MPWADVGTVIEQRCRNGALHRLRLAWECDGAAGAVLNLPEPLFGVPHRFESEQSGGVVPYTVYLHDEFGADDLNAQGETLAGNTTVSATLRVLLDGGDLPRPIAVGGRHVFRVPAAHGRGVFSLWFWPTMNRRLERRLIF